MPSAPHLFHAAPFDCGRQYRLTDGNGQPHPELDELFDSLDAAQDAALAWIDRHWRLDPAAESSERLLALAQHFGLEVSTPSGVWRTLRHPGSAARPG